MNRFVPAALVLLAMPAAAQSVTGNPKCRALIDAGWSLLGEDKYNEAAAKFEEARKADPEASGPVSSLASLFRMASERTAPENVEDYRARARALAEAALKLQPHDPIALEVLRALAGGDPPRPQHQAPPAAVQALNDGEALYARKDYAAARRKYAEALALDPACVEAATYLGDCWFAEGKYAEAEEALLKAAALDPLHPQAWRYLGDAQYHLGKFGPAEASTLSAIAAQPDYLPAWNQLASLRGQFGKPLARFSLSEAAKAARRSRIEGKEIRLGILEAEQGDASPTVWTGYAIVRVAAELKPEKKDGAADLPKSPFEAEHLAWTAALEAMGRMQAEKKSVKDETLRFFKKAQEAGQLKAAIFLLLYREGFRPEFEAWKKAEPKGIQTFIDTFGVRPAGN